VTVALVTGGAGGLGRAIARRLVEAGHAVSLAELPEFIPRAEEVAAELGERALAVPVDVREPATVQAAVEWTLEQFGSLDIAVCNAGLNIRKPSLEVTEADWDAVVDVNLRGVFFTAQAAARQMVKQGNGGKIVCLASIMGLVGTPWHAVAYAASKGGVVNMTRALAVEWAAHNIQVNSVAPTYVETPLTQRLLADRDFRAAVLARTPNGRLATPESIADAVAFLASPQADMITGVTLPVDGGWTAW
jgi:NAD(P)-dependent dehydrogenase (short-subunit alcohol dehydrogenase family)